MRTVTKAQPRHTTKRNKSKIPRFQSVEQATEFWDTHSTTEFEDEFEAASDVRFMVTRGEPKKALTVRMPQTTVEMLTERANEKGVSPSALIRMWILDRLRPAERHM